MTDTTHAITTDERADLLEALAHSRRFLRFTARDLTDEQAGRRTTASELYLGGLVKHVTSVERNWADFILNGPSAMPDFTAMTEADFAKRADEFRMQPGETLAGVLADYEETARRTDELVLALPDLSATHPLPEAPWNEPGADGRPAGCCCTSPPRPPSTRATPTSSASPWTAPRAWADRPRSSSLQLRALFARNGWRAPTRPPTPRVDAKRPVCHAQSRSS